MSSDLTEGGGLADKEMKVLTTEEECNESKEKLEKDMIQFLISDKASEIGMLKEIEHRLYLLSEFR